jgi:broad specificity phosphatase PhoE
MKVYFVRHGESEGNTAGVHQGSDSILSVQGLRQAGLLAERFKNIDIDIILSSPFVRARQTADIIARAIKKEVIASDLLIEKKFPSEFIGTPIFSEGPDHFRELHRKNWNNPEWHFADEENFYDVRGRGSLVLKFLESRNETSILVVTHGAFLSLLLMFMMHREQLTPELYYYGREFFELSNAGITLCDKTNDAVNWRLITSNDQAHLGDPEE